MTGGTLQGPVAWGRWAVVAGVVALLGAGGQAQASQCHVSERPEWTAFDFLDVGQSSLDPGAAVPAPLDIPSRLGPLPCSGHSDGWSASPIVLNLGLPGSFAGIHPTPSLWSLGAWPADHLDPRSTASRLDRPPRPA